MAREMIRQGGRTARIQKEVHQATRALLVEIERGELTVPMIAERAGVPPSTIYRRWGDLAQLLADVAVERLRPIADPDDTGTLAGDLDAFVVQYAEEMSSPVGRRLLRDVLADGETDTSATKCCRFTYDHLEVIAGRALCRGEAGFDVGQAIDRVFAPIVYHILFGDRDVGPEFCRQLLTTVEFGGLRAAA